MEFAASPKSALSKELTLFEWEQLKSTTQSIHCNKASKFISAKFTECECCRNEVNDCSSFANKYAGFPLVKLVASDLLKNE